MCVVCEVCIANGCCVLLASVVQLVCVCVRVRIVVCAARVVPIAPSACVALMVIRLAVCEHCALLMACIVRGALMF